MGDISVVADAPHLVELLCVPAPADSLPALPDRARGVMLGLAAGNLLGLNVEGASHRQIAGWYPYGVTQIDPDEAHQAYG